MDNMNLMESYRLLVDALLTHSCLHEGTDEAMADFLAADYADGPKVVLRSIWAAQRESLAQEEPMTNAHFVVGDCDALIEAAQSMRKQWGGNL